jgi:hypothetical protein
MLILTFKFYVYIGTYKALNFMKFKEGPTPFYMYTVSAKMKAEK